MGRIAPRQFKGLARRTRLDRAGRQAEPVACIVEFQSRRQAEVLERLAEYTIRVRRELRHGRSWRGRFAVIGALVSLTGRPQHSTLRMWAPEVNERNRS
jgi:hypothetical protein